jgi:hypothetical protein
MLELPKSTKLSKQLPKKAIYAKFKMNTAAKAKFDADIKRISIVNEISPVTMAITKGEEVSAFYVLLVSLKHKDYAVKTIEQISKLIDQNMLLVLACDDEVKLAIFHTTLIQSNWKPAEEVVLQLRGFNLDSIWENIITQVGDIQIEQGNSLVEQIIIDERRQKLQRQIAKLEKQARAEKQPKKKFELVQEMKKLQNDMEVLVNGY